MIYNLPGQNWVTPTACLWSNDAQIPGKCTIRDKYHDLRDLFVCILEVKIPDLGLLVEELKRVAQFAPSIHAVRSIIWQINAFAPRGQALDTLRGFNVLPVRKTDGTVELRSSADKFSIIDRQPWADAFQGTLDFFDFNLRNVRLLRPFLSSLSLETRHLSEIVVENSSFRGAVPEPSAERTRHLQRRAHALSR